MRENGVSCVVVRLILVIFVQHFLFIVTAVDKLVFLDIVAVDLFYGPRPFLRTTVLRLMSRYQGLEDLLRHLREDISRVRLKGLSWLLRKSSNYMSTANRFLAYDNIYLVKVFPLGESLRSGPFDHGG